MGRRVLSVQKRDMLKEIGKRCQNIRITCGYTQQQVADEIGEHLTNISAFENGINNSATILCWYVGHGFRW